MSLTAIELCAGAGGSALGIEKAVFKHAALVDSDPTCCATLRLNRPEWTILEQDVRTLDLKGYGRIDLLSGGLPCPPFSIAGQQLGPDDDRDLFPDALRLIRQTHPRAVMIENVVGFLAPRFATYRRHFKLQLRRLGYVVDWRVLNAAEFGVPQARRRVIIVAVEQRYADRFKWPKPTSTVADHNVGAVLHDLMAERGWRGATAWRRRAKGAAPTIVGGSKKHGGADLGPSRTREVWERLGVKGTSIAEAAPDRGFVGAPRLTNAMVKRLQAFPDDWRLVGTKTQIYKQIGNALPPPVAYAVGRRIRRAIAGRPASGRTKVKAELLVERS